MPLQKISFLSLLQCHARIGTQAAKGDIQNKRKKKHIICSLRRFSSSCNVRKQSRKKKIVGRSALGRHSSLAQEAVHGAIASATGNARSRLELPSKQRVHKKDQRGVCTQAAKLHARAVKIRKDSYVNICLLLLFSSPKFRVSTTIT